MKLFTTILLLFLHQVLLAGIEKRPFQILYAEDVYSNGVLKNNFEFVSEKEILKIKGNGILLLIHATGKSFEFTGEQDIFIPELIKGNKLAFRPRKQDRVQLDFLVGNKPINLGTVICRYVPIEIEFLVPSSYSINLGETDSLLLMWEDVNNLNYESKYRLTIKNLYDSTLQEFITDKKEFNLNIKPYVGEFLLILLVTDTISKSRSYEIGVRIRSVTENEYLVNPKKVSEFIVNGSIYESNFGVNPSRLYEKAYYIAKANHQEGLAIFCNKILAETRKRIKYNRF